MSVHQDSVRLDEINNRIDPFSSLSGGLAGVEAVRHCLMNRRRYASLHSVLYRVSRERDLTAKDATEGPEQCYKNRIGP